jgi:hypothetical protein
VIRVGWNRSLDIGIGGHFPLCARVSERVRNCVTDESSRIRRYGDTEIRRFGDSLSLIMQMMIAFKFFTHVRGLFVWMFIREKVNNSSARLWRSYNLYLLVLTVGNACNILPIVSKHNIYFKFNVRPRLLIYSVSIAI